MHLTRRTLLTMGAAAMTLRGAGNTRVRAGALVATDTFDALLAALKEIQALGYTGYSTTMRVLQTRSDRIDEMRGQLSETGLDLIGVRATLPKYAEFGADRALEDLARLAMAARQFGARTLMLHSVGLAPDGKFKPEEIDTKAKFLDLCARRCKETGVIFTYRTQEAEFQNGAAELTGLMERTDKNITYFDLDLARGLGAIECFRDHPNRTFAMEAGFGEPGFKSQELAAAIKHTKWISWLIDAAPGAESRAVMKKAFGA